MATSPEGGRQLLGKGKLYVNRKLPAGTYDGERFVGNVTEFAIGASVETKQIFSSASAGAPLLDEAGIRQTHTVSFKTTEHTIANFALFLLGDEGTLANGSGSVSDEAVTCLNLDRYIKLNKRNISLVTVTSSPAGTTFAENTDYTVDTAGGRLYIPSTSNITAGQALLVDYTYSSKTYKRANAALYGSIEVAMRFVGDPTRGPKFEAEIWRVSLTPDGQLSFVADEYGEFSFSAKVLDDSTNHANQPYYQVLDYS